MKPYLLSCAILIISCQSNSEKEVSKGDCGKFKNGKFIQTWQDDSTQYKIERNGSIQKEFIGDKGGYVNMKIKWLTGCNYELTFLNQHIIETDSVKNPEEIRKLNVRILQTQNDTCYIVGDNGIDQIRGVIFIEK